MVVEKPSLETVWGWLHAVPDPEIPVISLTDLGIIRDVQWQDDTLEVTVTPTYSGCPATTIINLDIETALRGHGIEKLALKRQLSPAWTSDWMTDARPAPTRRWPRTLPPLPIDASGKDQPVRIDPLQGAMALHRLSGTLRLF